MRCADLRSRLVPAPPTRDRLVRGLARRAARYVHGWDVSRQPPAAATPRRAGPASASRLRVPRAGHRRDRPAGAPGDAARQRNLHRLGGLRRRRYSAAWRGGRRLPASADAADGRDASCDFALGGIDAGRRVVAGILLRRKHRRRRAWQPARRVLPPARVRHGGRDLRRGGAQRDRGRARVADCAFGAGRSRRARRGRRSAGARVCHVGRLRRDCAVGHDRARG